MCERTSSANKPLRQSAPQLDASFLTRLSQDGRRDAAHGHQFDEAMEWCDFTSGSSAVATSIAPCLRAGHYHLGFCVQKAANISSIVLRRKRDGRRDWKRRSHMSCPAENIPVQSQSRGCSVGSICFRQQAIDWSPCSNDRPAVAYSLGQRDWPCRAMCLEWTDGAKVDTGKARKCVSDKQHDTAARL